MPLTVPTKWDGTRLYFEGAIIHLLPDAHLGRRFMSDVPLHRRGEREAWVEADFRANLMKAADDNAQWHICMGDLFDKPFVSAHALMVAFEAYAEAVQRSPNTNWIVIPGNHDLSRDLSATTSFDVFAAYARTLGVKVIREPTVLGPFGFMPWSPLPYDWSLFQSKTTSLWAVFGHWDVVNPSNPQNLVPGDDVLDARIMRVTGHDHNCRLYAENILVTGSLQPYSHAEDPTGRIYRTLSMKEALSLLPEERRMLCLRILLEDGEELPTDLDALQIKGVRAGRALDESTDLNVDDFDLGTIFREAFEEHGVAPQLADEVTTKFNQLRTTQENV